MEEQTTTEPTQTEEQRQHEQALNGLAMEATNVFGEMRRLARANRAGAEKGQHTAAIASEGKRFDVLMEAIAEAIGMDKEEYERMFTQQFEAAEREAIARNKERAAAELPKASEKALVTTHIDDVMKTTRARPTSKPTLPPITITNVPLEDPRVATLAALRPQELKAPPITPQAAEQLEAMGYSGDEGLIAWAVYSEIKAGQKKNVDTIVKFGALLRGLSLAVPHGEKGKFEAWACGSTDTAANYRQLSVLAEQWPETYSLLENIPLEFAYKLTAKSFTKERPKESSERADRAAKLARVNAIAKVRRLTEEDYKIIARGVTTKVIDQTGEDAGADGGSAEGADDAESGGDEPTEGERAAIRLETAMRAAYKAGLTLETIERIAATTQEKIEAEAKEKAKAERIKAAKAAARENKKMGADDDE